MQANVIVDPRGKYLKTHLECLEMMNIHPSDRLELFCILLKLHTTKFQGERSSLRRAPQKQENVSGMKMLTVVSMLKEISATLLDSRQSADTGCVLRSKLSPLVLASYQIS